MTQEQQPEALRLCQWFDEQDGFKQGTAAPHKWVLQANSELRRLHAENEELRETLQFVERWAVHHGSKPSCTPAEALSCIQHYPPIRAITDSYTDGKRPETFDPYARIAELEAQLARKVPTKQELADYLMQQDAVILSRSTHEGMLAATGHPTPPSMTAIAAQARKGEYLDGVNIPRLREALTFLGRGNGVGEGEVASKLSEYVNSIVRAVLACKELLRSGDAQAQRKPLTDEQIEGLLINWPKDGIAFFDFARAIERAHGITEDGSKN